MTTASVEILRADWSTRRGYLLGVRYAVFVEEQGVPRELEQDANDAAALHLLAIDARGRPVATARMLPDGHIGRMAVLPDWRGRGIGGRLLQMLVGNARDAGLPAVFLHAQTRAIPFYERFGFRPEGDEFLDAGIPHRLMRKPLRP
jgi:predicted GNAT family N-acyltransferase